MTIQLLPINRETDLPIKALIRQVGDALPTALSDVCREATDEMLSDNDKEGCVTVRYAEGNQVQSLVVLTVAADATVRTLQKASLASSKNSKRKKPREPHCSSPVTIRTTNGCR